MSIADTLNPFILTDESGQASQTIIYSALDEIVLTGVSGLQQEACYIPPEKDLIVYGIRVTLATNLTNPKRNISIFCDELVLLESGITIDVSATRSLQYDKPLQPEKPLQSNIVSTDPGSSGRVSSGDEIAAALKQGQFQGFFSSDPGQDWAAKGATGGSITIACQNLVVPSGGQFKLYANGAPGNAGVNGQSRNWVNGAYGGNAGCGGAGGDGGSVYLACSKAHDDKGNLINLWDCTDIQSNGGDPGSVGNPGDAFETAHGVHHYGSAAPPADQGAAGSEICYTVPNFTYNVKQEPVVIPDFSYAAVNCDLRYWELLYHRLKLSYIQNQPSTFDEDNYPPGWTDIGRLLNWIYPLMFVYGYQGKLQTDADISTDPELSMKKSVATAVTAMYRWYAAGETMWGFEVNHVSNLPYKTQVDLLSAGYDTQKDVRDMYISLKNEYEKAVQDQKQLQKMRDAADQAVQMHKVAYEALRDMLCGPPGNKSGQSWQEQLLKSMADCQEACKKLQTAMADFQTAGNSLWNFKLPDDISKILSSLQSMAFVISDPPAMAVMGGMAAGGLALDAATTIKTNDGADVSKGMLKKIDQFSGTLSQLADMSVTIGSDADRQQSELVLTELDQIDQFVSQFTDALGDSAKNALDDIQAYRNKINDKNELWIRYSSQVDAMIKEFLDYQDAIAKQHVLDQQPDELSKNMIDTVFQYTSIYLTSCSSS
ncbi:hypothetical protein [Leptolyngbya sp. 7M]|uniref:hypothetical protein n=1 Tax=Leptolyngbya sp. 7M TaxID=2812896 RepID=UPI001B8D591C|nr:hypothetical protein [Leptolyngbya sp. 7M]QYO62252.1 hypothetical protein JVX88_19325 [Leptolyngbya sp. 7M]